MKAFVVETYKKNGPLRLTDMPEPAVSDNDVLVRIEAAAVNLIDSKVRDGEFKPFLPYRPPFILGHDLAGTVLPRWGECARVQGGGSGFCPPA